MALELQLDTLEGVDEGIKGLYVENDGKFTLDVNGGMPDVSTLEGTLTKVRDELKESKALAKAERDKFNGIDMETYNNALEASKKAEEERLKIEEQKLLDENNAEQVWENRSKKRDADWQKKIDAEVANTNKEHEINSVLKRRALQGEISIGLGDTFHEYGKRDAIRVASELFTLDDNGRAIMFETGLDGEKTVVIGKDGKTPFSPKEWALSDDVRSQNPHWFTATGGGTGLVQGATQSHGGSRTVTRAQYDAMQPQAQSKVIKDGFKIVD